MTQAAQERLVAAVAVIDGVEQLIAGQLARVGEGLLQFGLECSDFLVVGFGCPGPAEPRRRSLADVHDGLALRSRSGRLPSSSPQAAVPEKALVAVVALSRTMA